MVIEIHCTSYSPVATWHIWVELRKILGNHFIAFSSSTEIQDGHQINENQISGKILATNDARMMIFNQPLLSNLAFLALLSHFAFILLFLGDLWYLIGGQMQFVIIMSPPSHRERHIHFMLSVCTSIRLSVWSSVTNLVYSFEPKLLVQF